MSDLPSREKKVGGKTTYFHSVTTHHSSAGTAGSLEASLKSHILIPSWVGSESFNREVGSGVPTVYSGTCGDEGPGSLSRPGVRCKGKEVPSPGIFPPERTKSRLKVNRKIYSLHGDLWRAL
jgi:hypothetical protein